MNGDAELLNFVYKNSQMGVLTINKLLKEVKNIEFKTVLETQLVEFRLIRDTAKEKLPEHGSDAKDITNVDKLKICAMISIKTCLDDSPSNIAEMLIIGSSRGIIDAYKNLKKYKEADQNIRDLMERLLKFEENNVNELKKFL